MIGNLTGFGLVGGRSSRMGSDNALMLYRGLPLAAHKGNQLSADACPVLLVGDPDRYRPAGFPLGASDWAANVNTREDWTLHAGRGV
jgi:molybdopterin-guanine dinucleotide biosynthesis protein A